MAEGVPEHHHGAESVTYEREPVTGTKAAKVVCRCAKGWRFHALNCPVRPGEYMVEYVERLEQRIEEAWKVLRMR